MLMMMIMTMVEAVMVVTVMVLVVLCVLNMRAYVSVYFQTKNLISNVPPYSYFFSSPNQEMNRAQHNKFNNTRRKNLAKSYKPKIIKDNRIYYLREHFGFRYRSD